MEQRYGFIHDKLDIKLLILYICDRVLAPLPMQAMQELTLCDDGISYFDFAESLAELVETEHLSMTADDCYAITDKGRKNGRICESSLPYSVRLSVDKTVATYNQVLRRQAQVKSSYQKRANGSFTVHLSLDDDSGNLLQLDLMAPNAQMAQILQNQFRENPERLYHCIIDHLLTENHTKA